MAALLLAAFPIHPARAGRTLDTVRAAATLRCGTITELNDETIDDTHGNLAALGADFCSAVAAATAGPGHLSVASYPSAARAFAALQKGGIDLLVGDTPDPGRARRWNVEYLPPIFFDAQGLMVRKGRGLASLRDLSGRQICFIANTDAETQLHRAVDRQGLKNPFFPFQEIGEMEAALIGGRCDAETADISRLAHDRTAFHAMQTDFIILPDRLSLDAFAPVVRSGDPEWARAITWVLYAQIAAASENITESNLSTMLKSDDPRIATLLGTRRGSDWGLFLKPGWAAAAIRAAGNYNEMIGRDTGLASPLRLDPGPNRPWTEGGILWAPPFR